MSEHREPKRGVSPGAIVIVLIVFFFVLSGVALYFIVTSGGPFGSRISLPTTRSSTAGDAPAPLEAETPSPSAAQRAATENGKRAVWSEQKLAWSVPASWSAAIESGDDFAWRSSEGPNAAVLSASVTPMPSAIASDSGLASILEEATNQERMERYADVKLVEIGGIKGVQFRDATPASDATWRLHWQAYRAVGDANQLLSVELAAPAAELSRHEDALYGVLYSMTPLP
jgi:hypothetical protein